VDLVRWRGKSRHHFVRVRVSKLNPLLLNVVGLRSKVVTSAHGVPTPLTQKGETQPDSDTNVDGDFTMIKYHDG
jgi:hypothetical protein